MSIEEVHAAFRKANQEDTLAPRALGMVVRQLRGKTEDVAGTIEANGLSVRFSGKVDGGQARKAMITDVVRIALGLNYPITDFVSQV